MQEQTSSNLLVRLFTEDRAVAVVISLNAAVLFLLAFDQLYYLHDLFTLLDAIFLVYFMIEAILKISQDGWKQYISSSWNRFDFLIVLISLPSLLLIFESKIEDVTFLFVFRIVRLARFFKFLRFVPNMSDLLAGIRRAFKASIFVVLAFFIYMFVISMISCRLFKDLAPDYFNDPLISFYSIFKVFTIEGWYEIPEAIPTESDAISFLVKFYFVVIVISGGLFGLSIVNAIFVDEMVKDNNNELLERVDILESKIDALLAASLHNAPDKLNQENNSSSKDNT